MNKVKKIFIRPSQLVLIGDQLMIGLGFMSALFYYFRLLSITVFPIHTIFYRLTLHIIIGVLFWFAFSINKKVIRFFNSKDYMNLIFIVFLIHITSISSTFLFPEKHRFKVNGNDFQIEIFFISFLFTSFYIVGSRFIINYLYFYYRKSKIIGEQKRLIIYGAGELGVFLKKIEMKKERVKKKIKKCLLRILNN